jgi:membrane fusion protein (multidrug efflux system)
MFVQAVVTEGVNEQAILIPQQSVSRDPRKSFALIVDSAGKVQQRMLSLDRASTTNGSSPPALRPVTA